VTPPTPPEPVPPADADGGPRRYRVEHRQLHRSTVIAALGRAKPHRRTLDPFVSLLVHQGKAGTVVLVDEATGAVVVSRRIARPAR